MKEPSNLPPGCSHADIEHQQEPFGHCDTCGAICDANGCTADRAHQIVNDDAPSVGATPGPWIVDEVNTPNGVSYFINHLYDDVDETGDDNEVTTHTDEVAEVVMDYAGDRALCNARLLAAAPELLDLARSLSLVHGLFDCIGPVRWGMLTRAIVKATDARPVSDR